MTPQPFNLFVNAAYDALNVLGPYCPDFYHPPHVIFQFKRQRLVIKYPGLL
jgi:hypothetical protein